MRMNFGLLHKFHRSDPELETSGFRREGPVTYRYVILSIAIAVFCIMPIIWYSHMPLADYPNHLARLQIHKSLSSNPYLSTFFEFRWTLVPNMGIDLLTFPLINYIPVP